MNARKQACTESQELYVQLNDKVSIITGAADGIGLGIAKRFVDAGSKVAIADINLAAAQQAARELGEDQAMTVEMDVSDEAAVNAGVQAVIERWGRVDVLISNAGVQIVHPVEEFPYAA